jgi:hypothetical protein
MTSQDRFTARRLSEKEVAKRAISYREELGASDDLCVNIIEILEFRIREFLPNFKLMIRRDLELDTTASTMFEPPRIFVRETIYDAACEGDFDARRILAHELGHLLLHSNLGGSMQRDIEGYSQQFPHLSLLESAEAQADSFARHFLITPHIAYESRDDIRALSIKTKAPISVARDAVRIAKRREMVALRTKPKG